MSDVTTTDPTTAADLTTATAPTPATSATTGTRARRVLAMKNLVPNPDWINTNIVAHGRGTHKLVARLYGLATAAERQVHDYNGKPLESIAIRGMFEAESALSGEVSAASTVYLPMAFAEQIEQAFKLQGAASIQLDVDIGLEATGKTIPYEWTVINYVPVGRGNVMQAMRAARRPGEAGRVVTIGADGSIAEPKALPAPVTYNEAEANANVTVLDGETITAETVKEALDAGDTVVVHSTIKGKVNARVALA